MYKPTREELSVIRIVMNSDTKTEEPYNGLSKRNNRRKAKRETLKAASKKRRGK